MYFVLVSGTPGVGKTTLSRLLASELGAMYREVGDVAKECGALAERDKIRGSYLVDISKVSKFLAKANQPMVIDGHVILRLPRKKINRVIVLRCNPATLALRLRRKKFPVKKIVENVLAEVTDVCLTEAVRAYGRQRIFELNTTEADVVTCVKYLATAVRRGIPRIGICDWLSELQSKQLQSLEAGKLWPIP